MVDGVDPRTLIPHREPYLFLTACTGGGSATAEAPEHAAELIEVCAQAAASARGSHSAGPVDGVMVGIRRFRIERVPAPGDPLRVETSLTARIGGHTLFNCRIFDADGGLVAHGDLAFAE